MKVRSIVVMGMMATMVFAEAKASRNGRANQGNNQFGFGNQPGWGSIHNRDLYQIREVQQRYNEYMRSTSKLANLYQQLDEITSKLGYNHTKIDELKENRQAARVTLKEKTDQVNRLEAKVAVLQTEKQDALEKVVEIEGVVASIDYDITAEEARLQPFKQEMKNKKKKVDNHASKFNAAKTKQTKAIEKLNQAKDKYERITAAYTNAVATEKLYKGQLAGIDRKIQIYQNQLDIYTAQHGSKIEQIQQVKAEIKELEKQKKKANLFSKKRKRLKREIEKKELILKAYRRSLPAGVMDRVEQATTRLAQLEQEQQTKEALLSQTQINIASFQEQAQNTQVTIDTATTKVEEAKEEFAPIKTKQDQLNNAYVKARKKLRNESTELNNLQDKKLKANTLLSNAQYQLTQIKDRIAQKDRKLENQVLAMNQIQIDIENMKSEMQVCKAEIKELNKVKKTMEEKELRLFDKLANTTARTHNNQVFHAFVGGLNTITPEMRDKISLAAANGAKIVLWGNLSNQELLTNIAPITGVSNAAQISISELKGQTESTQYFNLNVNMPAAELYLDGSSVPLLMTADDRVVMAAKSNDNGMGVVITSTINPNDMNEYDLKAFMEMIAGSNANEYIPRTDTDPSQDYDQTDPGYNDGDDDNQDPGHDGQIDPGHDDGNQGPIQPEVFSTGFKFVETTEIPDNSKAGVVIDMEIDAEKGFMLTQAELSVQIKHSYIGDIKIILISPEGKEVQLRYRKGGSGKVIDDIYTKEIIDSFAGEMIRGTWKLIVEDTYNKDTGVVEAVRFSIEGER